MASLTARPWLAVLVLVVVQVALPDALGRAVLVAQAVVAVAVELFPPAGNQPGFYH